jgi:hypothetical protein
VILKPYRPIFSSYRLISVYVIKERGALLQEAVVFQDSTVLKNGWVRVYFVMHGAVVHRVLYTGVLNEKWMGCWQNNDWDPVSIKWLKYPQAWILSCRRVI